MLNKFALLATIILGALTFSGCNNDDGNIPPTTPTYYLSGSLYRLDSTYTVQKYMGTFTVASPSASFDVNERKLKFTGNTDAGIPITITMSTAFETMNAITASVYAVGDTNIITYGDRSTINTAQLVSVIPQAGVTINNGPGETSQEKVYSGKKVFQGTFSGVVSNSPADTMKMAITDGRFYFKVN